MSRKTNIWNSENMNKILHHHPCRIYSLFIAGLQQRRGWAGREYELLSKYCTRHQGLSHQIIKWNSCTVLYYEGLVVLVLKLKTIKLILRFRAPWGNPGRCWPLTPKNIPEPSHGTVFREKFRSVYVVKGVWSLLKDLFFSREIDFVIQKTYWNRFRVWAVWHDIYHPNCGSKYHLLKFISLDFKIHNRQRLYTKVENGGNCL